MARDLIFLSVEDVLFVHQVTITNEGGAGGLVDFGLLEAAVMMPQQAFNGAYLHDGIAAMAAAYLSHIYQNHAFRDGNKRAAAFSAVLFLRANGRLGMRLPDPDALTSTTLDVASGRMSKEQLTAWMINQLVE